MKRKNTAKSAPKVTTCYGVIDFQTAYVEAEKTTNVTGLSKEDAAELELRIEKAYFNYDQAKVEKKLAKRPWDRQKPTKEVAEQFREQWPVALNLLQRKNNVCFYGVGDKKAIVYDFLVANFAQTHVVMVVDGNDANLTMETALSKLILTFHNHYFPENDPPTQSRRPDAVVLAKNLSEIISRRNYRVILFFNSLDGPNLLSKHTSKALAELTDNPLLNIVATFDRSNGPESFGIREFHRVCFVFLEMHTFQFFPGSVVRQKSRTVAKKGQSTDAVLGVLESFSTDQQ